MSLMDVQTALRALDLPIDTCIASLTAAALRRAYLSAALRLHPDKNNDPAAADSFAAAQEAHVTLLALSASGQAAEHEAASTARLVDLLLRALIGEDVKAELAAAGCYQPPKDFGIDLSVPFDRRLEHDIRSSGGSNTHHRQHEPGSKASNSSSGTCDSTPGSPNPDMHQLFRGAFRDDGLDEEGEPLEGWALPPGENDGS